MVTSQKAAAPVEVERKRKFAQPENLPCEEHLYVAPSSPDKLKEKLSQAYARIEDLELQLRNAKDRERRYKAKLKRYLDNGSAKRLCMSLQPGALG